MTRDLHFDNKQVVMTFIHNQWRVTATVYVGKDVRDTVFDDKPYDFIYLPLTLEKCVVLRDAIIYGYNTPYQESFHDHFFQDIEFRGVKFQMLDMDVYWDIKKGSGLD